LQSCTITAKGEAVLGCRIPNCPVLSSVMGSDSRWGIWETVSRPKKSGYFFGRAFHPKFHQNENSYQPMHSSKPYQ
jgi:hypothetical protein